MDMDAEHLEMATEKFELVSFDAFSFEQILSDNALQFVSYKIFQHFGLFKHYHIKLEYMVNFTKEIQAGYFKENPFHSVTHIVDSLQALYYFMKQ